MRLETSLIHDGRDPGKNHGIVNPPVYHLSTVLYDSVSDFSNRASRRLSQHEVGYGAQGSPLSYNLGRMFAKLEGGFGAVMTGTGLSAVAMALSSSLKAGDHLLMVDSVYDPTRHFCSHYLARMGIEIEYYAPIIGAGIGDLLRPNTAVVYMESPGSLTFEVQDIPAMMQALKGRNITTILDNTWAAGVFLKPLAHGIDMSVHAVTKYPAGHSDLVMGAVIGREEAHYLRLKEIVLAFGETASPDDSYLALRGMRSMMVRLKHQEKSALNIAQWLEQQPQVKRVLYPALPSHPQHALWKRDFSGASSLFGMVLNSQDEESFAKMLDPMSLFKMGASWGGYESLALPSYPQKTRTATPWQEEGLLVRLHIGLEHEEDLKEDLQKALGRL